MRQAPHMFSLQYILEWQAPMRGRCTWIKAVEGACKAISMGCEDYTNTECYNHTESQYIPGVKHDILQQQIVNIIFQQMPRHKGIVILPLVLPDTFTFGLYHTALMDSLWYRERETKLIYLLFDGQNYFQNPQIHRGKVICGPFCGSFCGNRIPSMYWYSMIYRLIVEPSRNH